MAVNNMKEVEMTDKQFDRVTTLEQFFTIQKALDEVTDPASRTILEEQKKEIIERLENDR